jgi:hypothetical protein
MPVAAKPTGAVFAPLPVVAHAAALHPGQLKPVPPKTASLVSHVSRAYFAAMPPGTPPSYEVLAESGSSDKRVFAVQLERRVSELALRRFASEIRGSETIKAETAVMMFYLPGMKVGHGVWAHVYYTPGQPDPKVTIVGLTTAEEERLVGDVRRDARSLIGAWLTASPAPLGKLTLYRERGRLFAEWGLRDGARFNEEVVETALAGGGWRYDRRDSGAGDHMLLTVSGALELRDRDDVPTPTQAVIRNAVDLRGGEQRADAKGNDVKPPEFKAGEIKASDAKSAKLHAPGATITPIGSATTTSATATVTGPGKRARFKDADD